MSAAVRLFVAVPCGGPLRAALTSRLDASPSGLSVRWTHPRTWHLTLQFLGEWPESRVGGLGERLAGVADRSPFAMPIGGLGAFPDLRRPRVLFLQLGDDGAAARLAGAVREKVAEIWPDGPQDHKRFKAHLTLARIRRPLADQEVKMLQGMDFSGMPDLLADRFILYSSALGPGGARHVVEAEYRLRKKGER